MPLAGHPVGALHPLISLGPDDRIESAYRFLIADAMPFGKNARIQLEHGGENQSTEHYQSVVYWYGKPGACLVQTDILDVGDNADEQAHSYLSPTASAPQTISSRYELSVDHNAAGEIYPETQDTGRFMTGVSEFTLTIRPDNLGLLLRRKLDYSWPDQRAMVFVADDRPDAAWQPAGTWYLAGSNSCVYSNPPGELDDPLPVVQTSNRRFREDEFLIASRLTQGRERLRVRIVFAPEPKPLLLEQPLQGHAWSELRYTAYAWVRPQ